MTSSLALNDLTVSKELDREALAKVLGRGSTGLGYLQLQQQAQQMERLMQLKMLNIRNWS